MKIILLSFFIIPIFLNVNIAFFQVKIARLLNTLKHHHCHDPAKRTICVKMFYLFYTQVKVISLDILSN